MTRVALVSYGSPDYLIDIVTDGMIRVLGRENAHLVYNRTSPNESKISHLFSGFGGENTFPIVEADCLIASTRSDFKFVEDWMNATGKPVALVDGEDDSIVRREHLRVKVYAKREYLKGRQYHSNVIPLPFGAIPESRPSVAERKLPVFFRATRTDAIRPMILKEIEDLGLPIQTNPVSKDEYNRILAGALVGVSARGAGWDTYRYWEIAYFGCALLSQRHSLVIPGDFLEDEEVILFESMDEFSKKLKRLLLEPLVAMEFGKKVQKACLERHLSTHRAKTVLEALL